jgi:hypothetical protein
MLNVQRSRISRGKAQGDDDMMTCLGFGTAKKANGKVAGKIRLADSYLPRLVRFQEPDMSSTWGESDLISRMRWGSATRLMCVEASALAWAMPHLEHGNGGAPD